MKKALVFSSVGLGDGLIFLTLSYNLFKNGYFVETYHPFLNEMQSWFPYTNIKPFDKFDVSLIEQNNFDFLKDYDLIIINSDYTSLNKQLLKVAKTNYPQKTFELHPSTCKSKNYLGSLKFDIKKNVTQNLLDFCKTNLNLTNLEISNGIEYPKNLVNRKYAKRIIIHATSKDPLRNWPKEKYKKLCLYLKENDFEPYIILSISEKKDLEDFFKKANIEVLSFNNLNETASFIYEAGFMIGNDSGIGHLASNLKIPTLTIFSQKRKQILWKPNFFIGKTIAPMPLINIKGFRIRDKYWYKTIFTTQVINKFKKLIKEFEKYESCNI